MEEIKKHAEAIQAWADEQEGRCALVLFGEETADGGIEMSCYTTGDGAMTSSLLAGAAYRHDKYKRILNVAYKSLALTEILSEEELAALVSHYEQ